MKRYLSITCVLFVLGPALAQEGARPISLEAGADYASRYIWRGFDLLPNNQPAIQPSLTLAHEMSGLSLNVWGSFGVTKRGGTTQLSQADEIDVTLDYTRSLSDVVDFSAGYVQYLFPNLAGSHTSEEIYAGLAFGVPLSPGISVAYDMHVFTGAYILGTAAVPLAGSNVPLSLDIAIGNIIGYDLGTNQSGLAHVDFGLSYALGNEYFSLVPAVHFNKVTMDAVNRDDELWFSMGAAFSY